MTQESSASETTEGTALDVVTLGETMLRLSPPVGYSLENAERYEVTTGGAESNMAIALARLGKRVGWVSRLPRSPVGRRVAAEIARHGVDVSRVVWADGARQGIAFTETGGAPRGNRVIYDRAHAAIAFMEPEQLDWDYIASARTLFLGGITPALSEGCRRCCLRALREAKAKGRRVVFDVNYRAHLLPPEEARPVMAELLEGADAVIAPLKDLRAVFGMPDDPRTAAQRFAEAYRVPLVVLTLGENGSLAYDGEFHAQPVYPTETHDRIGSGDAFAAGFLYGWDERGVAYGLLCGNASAALKQTYRGDVTWAGLEELLELVENEFVDPRRVKR